MHDTPIANLDAAGFDEFFAALWGKPPFAWQKDLAARVLERGASPPAGALPAEASRDDNDAGGGPWPAAIALPTASGKTACMDIAVFALAAQARRLAAGRTITAPRRIFFVVDRRIIVDEAYERARRLAAALASPEREILAAVATNLRYIACGGTAQRDDKQRPLAVHALRGGMYRSEAWARNPLQPAIIASTVDQTGSRLLFRAYGRSFGTWPVYAGLVGNDSLILLDEAHCAQPFLQTLHAVQRFRTWAETPIGRPFQAVVMSATPPGVNDVFKDESAQGADPAHPLGRRRLASKPATLQRIAAAEGASATIALATELVNAARRLLGGGRQAVVVFVNRVATARQTGRLLRDAPDDCDVLVLTGRMRPLDKENVAEQLKGLALHSDRSACRNLERPVVVVATQTLEVGADLDFDGLVTECASLDALRQRFGRLNRMGRDVEARAEILIRADQAAGPKHGEHLDPVYGEALPRTWNWLTEHTNDNGEVDFGIARLETLLPGGQALAELNAPAANAPVMLPAHIDCWAQTAPEPQPSPDVAPFLHGPRQGVADVQVCWRADVDLRDEAAQQLALESLALCPPGSSETLPVPVGVFRRWLGGQEPSDDPGADVEGSDAVAGHQEDSHLAARRVVRWQGARTTHEDVTTDPASIRPGDVVVIPTAHPGPWEQLGDLPSESIETPAALDVGDAAHRIARAKPILRLHPDVVAAWPDALPAKTTALSLLADLAPRFEDDPEAVAHAVRNLLTELSAWDAAGRWAWLPAAARELEAEFSTAARLRRACRLVGRRSLVLAGHRRIGHLAHEADPFSDEDDAAASGTSHPDGRPVLLRTHLPGVEALARQHAVGAGLPGELTEAVARAGLLHDLGKADPRFQSLLRGGSPWMAGDVLAKSADMPQTGAAQRRARIDAGYPEGGRHELLSVRLAETAPALLPEGVLRDLVLHLVASHHGYCRPFAPVVEDDEQVPVAVELRGDVMRWSGPTGLERLDAGVADRYWRLTRRYGWWGLAWLEALLRLADWRRSEWEETHDGGD